MENIGSSRGLIFSKIGYPRGLHTEDIGYPRVRNFKKIEYPRGLKISDIQGINENDLDIQGGFDFEKKTSPTHGGY